MRARSAATLARAITVNVVFTPGTVRSLLPFALSLLQGSGVHVRLVANGCRPDEVALMREVAATDGRISLHPLPSNDPVDHGAALNHLFEAFPEPVFAFADSDVLADGDFMTGLWPPAGGEAAVFGAPPVWLAEHEASAPDGGPFLSGRHRTLHDGTPIGGTYLAIYDRQALELAWRGAPRGFGAHQGRQVPRGVRSELAARGWGYRTLDTGRMVNLLLLLDGHALANRDIPRLHHIGGVSTGDFRGTRAGLRNLARLLRAGELSRVADGVGLRLTAARHRDPRRRAMNERRRIVLAHASAVLEAKRNGTEPPPRPDTSADGVDRRLAALDAAIDARYRPL